MNNGFRNEVGGHPFHIRCVSKLRSGGACDKFDKQSWPKIIHLLMSLMNKKN